VYKLEADIAKFRNIELLGGQVDHLIEKWKIREEFANHYRVTLPVLWIRIQFIGINLADPDRHSGPADPISSKRKAKLGYTF
jgi:hypothetical protein